MTNPKEPELLPSKRIQEIKNKKLDEYKRPHNDTWVELDVWSIIQYLDETRPQKKEEPTCEHEYLGKHTYPDGDPCPKCESKKEEPAMELNEKSITKLVDEHFWELVMNNNSKVKLQSNLKVKGATANEGTAKADMDITSDPLSRPNLKVKDVCELPKKKTGGNGNGCSCSAHYYGECGCGVDWTDYSQYNQALSEILSLEVPQKKEEPNGVDLDGNLIKYGYADFKKEEPTHVFCLKHKRVMENNICPECKKEEPAMELNEEELQIARETVGYLMSKAKELRHINANQNGMFKERANVLQKLIDIAELPVKSQGKGLVELDKDSVGTEWNKVYGNTKQPVWTVIEFICAKFGVAQPSNHNEMCGVHDGECFVCKEQTNSYGANPSLWAIHLPHIDGQTKHRFYHIKCLYPLVKIAQPSISREEIENLKLAHDCMLYARDYFRSRQKENPDNELGKTLKAIKLIDAILNHLESRKAV